MSTPLLQVNLTKHTRSVQRDPAPPHLGVIRRLFDDLGGHPEGRADEGVAFDLGVGELPRHAEIRQLHLPLLREQHVGGCGDGEGGQMEGWRDAAQRTHTRTHASYVGGIYLLRRFIFAN